MEFRVLGPLEVLEGGRALCLGGRKQRVLLAVLVMHAGRVVSSERLCEALWGSDPPRGWASTLQVHVSNLRKALDPEVVCGHRSARIVTRAPGYVLVAAPGQVDVRRFKDLVAEAGRATGGSHCDIAFLLGEALSLWRGPMLADLVDNPVIRAGVVGMEEVRMAAVEDRIEAELALGVHGRLIGELEQLVVEYPLRERFRGQLMVALYRSGRQVEALAVYRQARRDLVEGLGLDPSPFLRRLEAAILEQSPALEPPKPGPAPTLGRRELPGPLVLAHQLSFVGRGAERELLWQRWKLASSGHLLTVLIGGEPGIGKSRIVTETGRAAHGEGATVLYGHCDGELRVPYQPFMEAIGRYLHTCSRRELADLMAIYGSELVLLVPELARRFPNLRPALTVDADSERFRLFDAVVSLLAAASTLSPIVLVLDDLHWATRPTLLLLRHLLGSAQSMALLVIGTYRDAEVTGGHPLAELLADLRGDRGVDRLRLGGLGDDEVLALVEEAVGHALESDTVSFGRALRRDTGGNPFFVIEMLRHLVESGNVDFGALRCRPLRVADELAVPSGVREVIDRRLARLPESGRRALRAGAVIGAEFTLNALSIMLGTDEDEVLEAVDTAISAALVSEMSGRPGQFSFTHALIRKAIYEGIGVTRRARLHHRFAEALEELSPREPGPHLAALADHWTLSGLPEARLTAVGYSRRAGDWALDNLAYEEAAAHYQRALGALTPDNCDERPQHCDLLLALGDAQRRAGDAEYRVTMAAAAEHSRALGDAERMVRAALGSSRPCSWFISVGYVDEALVALYEEALARLDSGDSLLRARLLAQLAVEIYWTPARGRRRTLCREAVGMARRAGDLATLGYVLASSVVATWEPATLEERRAVTSELVDIGLDLSSREVTLQGRLLLAGCLFEAGAFDQGERELAEASGLAELLHQPFYTWLIGTIETMHTILTKGPEQGGASACATYELGQRGGQADAALIFAMHYAVVLWDQGRIGDANQVLLSYVTSCPAIPAFRAALALTYCYLDRRDAAREHFEQLAAGLDDLPVDFAWYAATTFLAETCAYLGDTARASKLYDALLPFGDRLVLLGNGESCLGSAWRVLALLATTLSRWTDAERHFASALAVNRRIGAASFAVRTQRGYAEMLLLRAQPGDEQQAMALARGGRQAADDLGMLLERELLDRVLRNCEFSSR